MVASVEIVPRCKCQCEWLFVQRVANKWLATGPGCTPLFTQCPFQLTCNPNEEKSGKTRWIDEWVIKHSQFSVGVKVSLNGCLAMCSLQMTGDQSSAKQG